MVPSNHASSACLICVWFFISYCCVCAFFKGHLENTTRLKKFVLWFPGSPDVTKWSRRAHILDSTWDVYSRQVLTSSRQKYAHTSVQQRQALCCGQEHMNSVNSGLWASLDQKQSETLKVCGGQMRQETQPWPCFGSCNCVVRCKCSVSVRGSERQYIRRSRAEFPIKTSLIDCWRLGGYKLQNMYDCKISTFRQTPFISTLLVCI